MSVNAMLRQLRPPSVLFRQSVPSYRHPKANLQVLKSAAGPFSRRGMLSVWRRFYVLSEVKDFKADMLKQFDAHLFTTSRTRPVLVRLCSQPQRKISARGREFHFISVTVTEAQRPRHIVSC